MLRILHCDDDETFRYLVRVVLADEADIEIEAEATDGETCLQLAAQLQPDVVLLDESMPGMSGSDVLPLLVEVSPSSRVVLLSSYGAEELREQALDLGAAAFLEKHGIVDSLAGAVRQAAGAGA